ncbi:phosphonate ABC transporter ATP-binding protein [Glutamicibacter sp. MNS18]|uniref:phosphonate ABC transporter ATP-binding protein n=1 Tax=Glutamicibacter sp. MNS18 TaxID=2989817 RepID=UPI002236360D|nr:phosphonate ABC transporter ATP-binding protein [Glutamicibacter sp. MNS18]MCW4467247.1 phosphonate ABC transporter ATP-binding protein [Glutamicibacter sp. MNS18]
MARDRYSPPALGVSGLTKSYHGRPVLKGVDFQVECGELVAFLGANGSGKSTTLKCVAGLAEPDAGTIRLQGTELSGLSGKTLAAARSQAAMVFQKIHLVPRRTALDNVCAGALARTSGPASLSPLFFSRALREEALDCLDRVGLADRALEKVGRLSGGQQQRVAVARALCQRAGVLLADEPVSALDPNAAEHIMALLAELAHTHQLAVAAVLHQPALAQRHADRAIGLLHGRIVFDGPAAGLGADIQDQLYSPERTSAA